MQISTELGTGRPLQKHALLQYHPKSKATWDINIHMHAVP